MSQLDRSPEQLSWKNLLLSRSKLKASSRTSALLSGFAMVAMVEIDINPSQVNTTNVTRCTLDQHCIPSALLICFAVLTTILISVHLFALMISTCILPHIDAAESQGPTAEIIESPHYELQKYIELAWGFSTVVGIFLFLCEIIVLCWVKFITINVSAAYAGTATMIPVLVVFTVFAFHFYRRLSRHEHRRLNQQVQALQRYAEVNLDPNSYNVEKTV